VPQGDAVTYQQVQYEVRKSFASADFKEGVAHFLKKRRPAFTGR
jgi:enoyl-CoA hydratase/carnithine racemase